MAELSVSVFGLGVLLLVQLLAKLAVVGDGEAVLFHDDF